MPSPENKVREPGSPRAFLAGVLCVLLGAELLVAAVTPALVAYAVVSFVMPATAYEVLNDGWLQKWLLRLDARFEGRERAAFEAFSPLWDKPPQPTGMDSRGLGDGSGRAGS